MKTKAKKFSHKLLALFMALLMALTCFSGVLTAYGASDSVGYTDDDVEYNSLAWDVLSDEQLATALLDYADEMLAEYGPQIDTLLKNALPTSGIYYYDAANRQIGINAAGIIKATVKVYVHSVDEVMETLESVASVISSYSSFIGDAGNLQFGSTNGMRRSNTSSCDIIRGVLGILQKNSADYNGKDVLGEFLRGGFDLGTVGSLASIDVYKIIANALNVDQSRLESDFVYNLVQSLIFNNTKWFTADEIAAYEAGTKTFVYDEVLMKVLTDELLDKISVLVTYPDGTSSATRKAAIDEKMESEGLSYEAAATALGYDPNLKYSEEEQYSNNILLFCYGDNKISLSTSDSLFTFGYKALNLAWSTVLKDTVKLLHVNNNVDRGHGSNFDNVYYYWYTDNEATLGAWDSSNLAKMYSTENLNAWANDVYADYSASSAEEFLSWVKDNYRFDRTVADDATGIWSDIDETTLFNKVRYSPLADYGFNIQTGPINLYFMQTGTANLDAFFETFANNKYSSLVAGLNDCLVAAVQDIFVNRDNIYSTSVGDTSVPTMATINPTSIDKTAIKNITTTLVGNALKIVQYTADTTDNNILNGFYTKYGSDATLTESNLEEAMIPMLIACIGQVNLGGGKLESLIHPEDWNGCKDAEAVAYVCLSEYLSYVLPNKDYSSLVSVADDGTITATLEGTILPMARDAVSYVMQGYVPVYDKDGNPWDVEDRAVDDENTIFDLLNSVVCYYGNDYTMANRKDERAMGVASLLGICDANGKSLVTTSNTIWKNFDLIINKLLPVVGTLQGDAYGYGNASSYDLIWKDIVLGVLEIGDTSIHSSGLGGVSNFINELLTFVSAEPIQSTAVVTTVYDVAKDLINGLLGPRYDGQSYTPVPDATSTHPFDDLLKKNVLVGTSGTNIGVLQKAICNFVEFSGYGTSGVSTYPDSILRGLLFAVQAVNSFIPEAVSNISDHSLKMASAEFDTSTQAGAKQGIDYTESVTITNNSSGVNNAYVDGVKDEIVQLSRYYLQVTGAQISGSSSCSIATPDKTKLVAPGESMALTTTTRYIPDSNYSTTYEVVITYNICDKDGTVLYSDLQTRAYKYLTGATSWQEVVYPTSRSGMLNSDLESDSGSATKTVDGYNAYTTSTFGSSNYLVVGYPEYVVLSTSNLGAVSDYQLRIRNNNKAYTGANRSVDGLYYYDTKSVYDDSIKNYVDVNSTNAIPVWDKTTGDLLREELYDYSTDGGQTWNRGTNNAGYTEDEVGTAYNALTDQTQKNNFTRRTHVAYTLDEATKAGIIQAYHVNSAGVYEYVYMKTGGGTNYDTTLSLISMRGPCDGFYINFTKVTLGRQSSQYAAFCNYDGETSVQAGTYDVNICCYNGNSSGYCNFKLVIADDSSASSLDTKYKELSDLMSNYRQDDFTDQNVYTLAAEALTNALAVKSTVLTPTTAAELSDNTQLTATTKSVTSEYGDKAYVPYTSSDGGETTSPKVNGKEIMPAGVKADAYLGGSTVNGVTYGGVEGVYYFDAACTMPIYSNVPLTSDTDGKDPAGIEVIKDDEGVYYLKNAPVYETEWDLDTYSSPWAKDTDVQATNSKGQLLYSQVQYVYRDKDSTKVNSTDEWYAKFPVTSYVLIPNTGDDEDPDNRGLITQANDNLEYVIEQVEASINTSIAQKLYTDMSLVRYGLNSENFEVVTYNKMVDIAKEAEKSYTLNIEYTYEEPVLDSNGKTQKDALGNTITETVSDSATGVSFSDYSKYESNDDITITKVTTTSTLSSVQVDEYLRLFNIYLSKVVERGYIGDKLEEEISCASGNTYNNLTVTSDGNIAKTSASATPRFGSWSADGILVNEDANGAQAYTTASWTAYISALAAAVEQAQLGNGDYAHKAETYYQGLQKNDDGSYATDEFGDYIDDYTAQVTDNYTLDSNLQKAEIALLEYADVLVTVNDFEGGIVTIDGTEYTAPVAYEKGETITIDVTPADNYEYQYLIINGDKKFVELPYTYTLTGGDVEITPVLESSGITVSGTVMIATDLTGTDYTVGIVGLDIVANGEVVATTAKDGTFTATIPAGTTELTVSGQSSIPRTVTLSGTSNVEGAVIPVVICDYNNDKRVNAADMSTFSTSFSGDYDVYCDYNGDGKVNAADMGVFSIFSGNTVTYAEIALD